MARKLKKYIVIGPRLKYGEAGGAMEVSAYTKPEAKQKAFKTFKKYNPKVTRVSDLEARRPDELPKESKYGYYQKKWRK